MSFSLVDISNCGGHLTAVHFALFFMSVAAVSIVLERLWYFRRSGALSVVIRAGREASDEGLGRAARRRAMERAGREERHLLGRGLRGLLTVGLVAPIVGLLGSVTVLMNLFRGMALTGSGSLELLGYGLSEALVPFAWALGLAAFCFAAYGVLERRLERVGLDLAKAALP